MASYVISWVRHGEAFSNALENLETDIYIQDQKKSTYTVHKNVNYASYKKEIRRKELEFYDDDKDIFHPYIAAGMNKLRDIVKQDELKKLDEKDEHYKHNKKMVDDRFNMVSYNWDKHVKPSEWNIDSQKTKPPSSWLLTPTLTYVGVKQSIKLGEYLKNNINNYGYFICSPTVRTIMTALYAILTAFYNDVDNDFSALSGKKLIITPYINEPYNGAGIINLDRANAGIPTDIIKTVIEYIAEFVANDECGFFSNKITKKEIIEFIDTDLYKTEVEEVEKKNQRGIDPKIDVYVGDSDKITEILKKIIKGKKGEEVKVKVEEVEEGEGEEQEEEVEHIYDTATEQILAFSHGKLIGEMKQEGFKKVFRDEIKQDNSINVDNLINVFFPGNCSLWNVTYNENLEMDIYNQNLEDDNKEGIIKLSSGITGKTIKEEAEQERILNDIIKEKIKFPFTYEYAGGNVRNVYTSPKEAMEAALKEYNMVISKPQSKYFCGLGVDQLRGQINRLWLECYSDIDNTTSKQECIDDKEKREERDRKAQLFKQNRNEYKPLTNKSFKRRQGVFSPTKKSQLIKGGKKTRKHIKNKKTRKLLKKHKKRHTKRKRISKPKPKFY